MPVWGAVAVMRQGLALAPQSLPTRPVDSTMEGTGSVGSVGAASSGATVLGWDTAQDGQGGDGMLAWHHPCQALTLNLTY